MSRAKGQAGEDLALEYLLRQNYKLVKRNFRSSRGEVDIIVSKDETIVFVEVKSWASTSIQGLEYSINRKKVERIMATAQFFLQQHPEFREFFLRFDVIYISGAGESIEHFPNAFTESGFP